jgi:DNA-binding MarR family transcriptional regulator
MQPHRATRDVTRDVTRNGTRAGARVAPRRPQVSHAGAGDDVQAAVQAFRRIVQRLRVSNRRVVRGSGLTAAQQFVLAALDGAPAESVQELARRTMTDRSSVATVVERLREEHYVVCRPSPVDHRRTTIRISARGREALARAPEPPTALLVRALLNLQAHERTTLATLLTRLTSEMGLLDEPASMLFEDAPSSHAGHRAP